MTTTEETLVRQPAACQQAEMLQLLSDILDRVQRIEEFIGKYEPMIARYRRYGRS